MHKIIAPACGLLLFFTATTGRAQRFNLFAGYSYSSFGLYLPQGLQLGPLSDPIKHSLNGWNGSLEARVLPFLGIVADFSGHYGNATIDLTCSQYTVPYCGASDLNVGLYTFSAGPQVSLRLRRIEPYAHALFGADVLKESSRFHETSFADVLGGGIDIAVIPRLAWRVQADLLQTRFPLSSYLPYKQNSLRLSTGVVLRF